MYYSINQLACLFKKPITTKRSVYLLGILFTASIIQGCAVATIAAVTAGATVISDRRTFSKQIDDHSIEFIAHNELLKNKALADNTNINIVSVNGIVLVVGQAPNTYLRDLVIKTINKTPDIVSIHNQVRIAAVTSITRQSNDVWLTSKVKSTLLASGEVNGKDVKVVTENAEVFLLGLVSVKEADIVVEIVRNISGVDRVIKAFEYIQPISS
jgi:osmotically-inducible protein OsmY